MKKIGELSVCEICLGTVNFGTTTPEPERQLSLYIELGGNFIDTAHMYGDWAPGAGRAASERTIGKFLRESGADLMISSKGGHPALDDPGVSRVTPEALERDLEEGLRAIGRSWFDIWSPHRDDPSRPVSETIDFLEFQRKKGNIRYYGCSNWRPERIAAAQEYAKRAGYAGFIANQPLYSLADVNTAELDPTMTAADGETRRLHRESGLEMLCYMSMGRGSLSKLAAGAELTGETRRLYENPRNREIAARLAEISAQTGVTPAQAQLRFIIEQDFPATPLVTFSSEAQLRECMGALQCSLGRELMSRLSALKQN